jgi:hypothetical protein
LDLSGAAAPSIKDHVVIGWNVALDDPKPRQAALGTTNNVLLLLRSNTSRGLCHGNERRIEIAREPAEIVERSRRTRAPVGRHAPADQSLFVPGGPSMAKRSCDRTTGVVLRGTESLLTHRWSGMDSNVQFRAR